MFVIFLRMEKSVLCKVHIPNAKNVFYTADFYLKKEVQFFLLEWLPKNVMLRVIPEAVTGLLICFCDRANLRQNYNS